MIKSIISSFTNKYPSLHKVLSDSYHIVKDFWKPKVIDNIDAVLEQYNAFKKGKVYFLQIGANDGTSQDDYVKMYVKEHQWKGILVEPLPSVFQKLVENYLPYQNQLVFEQVAIGRKNGTEKFYSVGEGYQALPGWVSQLSSFNYEVILRHKEVVPDIEQYIKKIDVKVETISSLLKRHKITRPDIIQIDTEGFDAEIIAMIEFSDCHPDIVIFENRHLSDKAYKNTLGLLSTNGYKLYSKGPDTLAIDCQISRNFKIEVKGLLARK